MNPQTNEQLTFWQADSLDHANPIVLPGNEKARKMIVTSGQKCLESYKNSSQLGLLVKMLLTSPIQNSNGLVLTWKAKVTKHNRLLFQLHLQEQGIEEKEHLLFPTPLASETGYRKGKFKQGGTSLSTAIGGTPNPMWVEWLMGFPIGWTDLEV